VSSGTLLKEVAKNQGFDVIGLFTVPMEAIFSGYHLSEEDLFLHCDTVIHSPDPQDALQRVKETAYKIEGVFAGMESGVEMADHLAHALHLPGNPIELSQARRDKYEMREAIRKAGLSCPDFRRCYTERDLWEFAGSHEFPLVIKTPKGAGTNNVFVCETVEELNERFAQILSSPDYMGAMAKFALIEEYIDGPEYIVDLFSDGENIHVTDVWLYEKGKPGGPKNLCWSCMTLDPKEIPGVVEYAIEAAKALRVERGASHAEIKNDPRKGPVLVELGARLAGAGIPPLLRKATNFDLYSGVLSVFTGRKPQVPEEITIQKSFAIVFGVSFEEGEVVAIEGIEEIRKLPSYLKHVLHAKAGDTIQKSVDMKTTPLFVYLAHKDPAQLKRDVDAVHRLFHIKIK
jgi:biotin carboxylase